VKKILIVEDSNEILENTAEILQLAGYNIATAVNGVEGLKKAISEKPDLILCDIMMPQMNGSQMLGELKKNIATKNIPFLFFTASAEKSEIKEGLDSGAFDYIVKPFDPDELVNIIRNKIGSSETDPSIVNL
jgi:DNA-binding response OmpR family regulator